MIRGERADGRRQELEALDSFRVAIPSLGVRIQGRPRKRSARAASMPASRRTGERMAADESQALGQMTRRFDDRLLRAPDIGHDRVPADARCRSRKHADVLTDRSRQQDEVRRLRQGEVVSARVSGMQAQAASTTAVRSIATMRHVGHASRSASATDPPIKPAADDGDLVKHAMLNAEC